MTDWTALGHGSDNDLDALSANATLALATVARDPHEGALLARQTYARATQLPDPHLESECALALALVENFLGNYRTAERLTARVLHLEDERGERSRIWQAWRARAVACRELGEHAFAQEAAQRAGDWCDPASAAAQASYNWLLGDMACRNTNYLEAQSLLEKAEQEYFALGQIAHAARCRFRYAQAVFYLRPGETNVHTSRARQIFEQLSLPLDLALCEWMQALYLGFVSDRQDEALASMLNASETLDQLGAPSLACSVRIDQAVLLIRLGRHREAEPLLLHSRTNFAANRSMAEIARCNINLAALYNQDYRHHDAIPLLIEAKDFSLKSGRIGRAARCQGGLADAYSQLGRYDRALNAIHDAIDLFEQQKIGAMVAACLEVLAGIHDRLGQYADAEQAYRAAAAFYAEHQLTTDLASCQIRLAELYLNRRDWAAARSQLAAAKTVCEANSRAVSRADCDRLLSEVALHQADWASARHHLAAARTAYEREAEPIRIALCDLIEGELCLATGDLLQAESFLVCAREQLADILPDVAWRANRALGDCALRRGNNKAALEEYLRAVRSIHALRAPLSSERLSASYFGEREPLFLQALDLAIAEGAWQQALLICDATHTTTFTLFLQQHRRSVQQTGRSGAALEQLAQEATQLRQELAILYRQMDAAGYVRSNGHAEAHRLLQHSSPAGLLEQFKHRSRRYEEVWEQIRLAEFCSDGESSTGKGLRANEFALKELRRLLNTQVGPRWHCLVYHEAGQNLCVLSFNSEGLSGHSVRLTRVQQEALNQCASNKHSARIQNLSGDAEYGGQQSLRELHDVLIPADVREHLDTLDLLVIVPHGRLHALPFQALRDDCAYLIERAPLLYAPSLHAFQILLAQRDAVAQTADDSIVKNSALLCGVSEFGDRAEALPGARAEIDSLAEILGEAAMRLDERNATATAIRQLSDSGALAAYRIIHFATHGIADSDSPLQSRILLHDSELTAADAMDLRLQRALVTLSVCQSAEGAVAHGDELLNLARVFFYAGAQTLVASQWPAADGPTRLLMEEFYRRMTHEETPARALQQAQRALARAGRPPYEWAAFNLIGAP